MVNIFSSHFLLIFILSNLDKAILVLLLKKRFLYDFHNVSLIQIDKGLRSVPWPMACVYLWGLEYRNRSIDYKVMLLLTKRSEEEKEQCI